MSDITHISGLTPDPSNARRRGPRAEGMLVASLQEVGAARSIVIDEAGVVLAGNGTLNAAAEAGIKRVKVVEADGETLIAVRRVGLTPQQKRRLALYDNRTAELAEWDLEQLTKELDAGIQLADLWNPTELEELLDRTLGPEPSPAEEEGLARADVPDALFATDNEWQVPVLDINRQADAVDLPVVTWGSVARTKRMRGTWHFYAEDYRYEALWDDPSDVPNTGCVNAVEPNFSLYEQTPRAVALFRVYQKRWIARWWQTQGIRVFVDLNVSEDFADMNMLGVPEGWRAYATRGYNVFADATEREYARAVERARSTDILFLVYGGGKEIARLCGKRGWVHVGEHMDRVKEARRGA